LLLIKLIQIAFILKDLKLDQFFKDGKCDVQTMTESLKDETVFKLAKIATGKESVNQIDAIAGIINFFLSLVQQAKPSPELVTLIVSLPFPQESKEAILRLLGKISTISD